MIFEHKGSGVNTFWWEIATPLHPLRKKLQHNLSFDVILYFNFLYVQGGGVRGRPFFSLSIIVPSVQLA